MDDKKLQNEAYMQASKQTSAWVEGRYQAGQTPLLLEVYEELRERQRIAYEKLKRERWL
jgi:hypothetical protein